MATTNLNSRTPSQKSLANLVQNSTTLSEQGRKEINRRGAIKSAEVRRQKKQIRELVKIALDEKTKDLPISKEKKQAMIEAVGMKDTAFLSQFVAQTIIQGAIIDRDKYSIDKILDFDGSNEKVTPENVFVANFNITKGADDIIQRLAKKAKNHAESDHEDI